MLAAGIGLLLLASVAYPLFLKVRTDTITVTNAGTKPIRSMAVTVCAADYLFHDISGGGQRTKTFSVTGDSGLRVQGQFADGTPIKGEFGYVTKQPARHRVEVVIHGDGSVTGRP